MLVFACICTKINAQWFVSGGLNIGYYNQNFQLALKPSAGYEFNDRWAVGVGLGMGMVSSDVYGYAQPYVRFNCWNNKRVFIDIKGSGEVLFKSKLKAAQIGLVPSVRFKINDHFQVYGDVGFAGAEYYDGDWGPSFGVGSLGIGAGFIYRF